MKQSFVSALFLFSISSLGAELPYYSRKDCGANGGNSIARAIVAETFGLDRLNVVVCDEQVRAQSRELKNRVKFESALRKAMTGFLSSKEDPESPLRLTIQNFFGDRQDAWSVREAKLRLHDFMNQPGTKLVLLNVDETAEGGPSDNSKDWMFYLTIPGFEHMFFADIERMKKGPALVWGFN